MTSLTPEFLGRLRFASPQLASLRALGEHRGREALFVEQSRETLQDLREVAVIESTESSNRLEGVVVSRPRLRALVLAGTAPVSRSEQEIAGYRDALALIHDSGADMPFSPGVLQQIHTVLYRYLPQPGGQWKSTGNDIVEHHPDGSSRVRFRPVAPHLTPAAIETMTANHCEQARLASVDALVLTPLAVLDFLCIHPFPDGNGRTARLLTLQLLYRAGYGVGRYISLERIFEESKQTYYETLETSSIGWHEGRHDVMPWLNYFWGVMERAYTEFEDRVGAVEQGRGNKSERVRRVALARLTPFSISELEQDCPGISRDTVRAVLRAMKAEGLIEPTGRGRGARWRHRDR